MSLLAWIRDEHEWVRGMFELEILGKVPFEKFGERPHPSSNSLSWVVWHLARIEDIAVNSVLRDLPQIFVVEGWKDKTGVKVDTVAGMQNDDVDMLSTSADGAALLDYWKSVSTATAEWLLSLTEDDLDFIPDLTGRQERFAEGTPPVDQGYWEYLTGKTLGYVLTWPVIRHGYMHIGEATTIRGLLGFGVG